MSGVKPTPTKGPGCLFAPVWPITFAACAMSTMWAGDWLKDQSLDHGWLIPVGVGVMLGTTFGGSIWVTGRLSKWWLDRRYRRVAAVVALELASLPVSLWLLHHATLPRGHYDGVFAEHKDAYLALQPEGEADGPPRLKGRCVVVAPWGNGPPASSCFDTREIPPSIRAEEPDQVETVIQLRRGKVKPGKPPAAELETCEITIIEWKTRRLLGRHTLVGHWRQETIKRPSGRVETVWTGRLADDAEFRWIRKLPREP